MTPRRPLHLLTRTICRVIRLDANVEHSKISDRLKVRAPPTSHTVSADRRDLNLFGFQAILTELVEDDDKSASCSRKTGNALPQIHDLYTTRWRAAVYKGSNDIWQGYRSLPVTEAIRCRTTATGALYTKNAQLENMLVAFMDHNFGEAMADRIQNENMAHDIQSGHSSKSAAGTLRYRDTGSSQDKRCTFLSCAPSPNGFLGAINPGSVTNCVAI
ncbi:hypothetical protein POJ06DRAFT_298094 [Lipomyces tetrasporus]|uniref:Uncharacterized protein n=1 Tax=Lipomyces tetrasporus TaxID=54092 RepID=A0AAD7R0V3_9ASCO|nr:uncharacterized protein POJ06DRAFT_298094 [Lipomyces tetrasporus]KAJ8103607.1 hypothetical protein POJ06DRAFT_298094 [Lipomyces tetrasporus]